MHGSACGEEKNKFPFNKKFCIFITYLWFALEKTPKSSVFPPQLYFEPTEICCKYFMLYYVLPEKEAKNKTPLGKKKNN